MQRSEVNLATLANNLRKAGTSGFVCRATWGTEVALYELAQVLEVTRAEDGAYEFDLRKSLREQMDPAYLTPRGKYRACSTAECSSCYRSS